MAPTPENVNALLALVNSQTLAVKLIVYSGDLVLNDLREALLRWWPSLDHTWEWRDALLNIFRRVGYLGTAPPPQAPVSVHRGVSTAEHRDGLSWTTDFERARWFATDSRNAGGAEQGFVYSLEAPPEIVLGRFTDRSEDEYVLDFELLPGSHETPVRRSY